VRRRQRHRKYAVGASFVSGKPERAAEIVVLIAEIVVGLAIGAEERTVLPATSRQPHDRVVRGALATLRRQPESGQDLADLSRGKCPESRCQTMLQTVDPVDHGAVGGRLKARKDRFER
jgi:hypothetical protein